MCKLWDGFLRSNSVGIKIRKRKHSTALEILSISLWMNFQEQLLHIYKIMKGLERFARKRYFFCYPTERTTLGEMRVGRRNKSLFLIKLLTLWSFLIFFHINDVIYVNNHLSMKGVCLSKPKMKNIRHFEVINILQMFKSSDFRSFSLLW